MTKTEPIFELYPFFEPPEVLKKTFHDKSIVWSLGTILYFLLKGTAPFLGITTEEISINIFLLEYTLFEIPEIMYELPDKMLKTLPESRIDVSDINSIIIKNTDSKLSQKQISSMFVNMEEFPSNRLVQLSFYVVLLLKVSHIEIEEKYEYFQYVDRDNDGMISFEDFSKFLETEKIKRSKKEIKSLYNKLNIFGRTEGIDFHCFCSFMFEKIEYIDSKTGDLVFNYLDQTGGGAVDLVNVYKNFVNTTDEEFIANIQKDIKEIDKDGNNLLEAYEFSIVLKKYFKLSSLFLF